MIIVSYKGGANRNLQEKIDISHGQKFYNKELENIIKKIINARLNFKYNQINRSEPPYKTQFIEISDKQY